jgi:CheY-like chemotaxis protein/HPt (histidine-containing phosphotransfer) domain-containing protein
VRLRQLLLNLVGNAVKFTEAGSVEVIAGLSPGPPALVQIEIVDTGIGIPADKLECIFDPFTQADNSVPRRFGGTGLGLAISRRIARALGGELTVRSEVGKGSHFLATIDPGPLQGARLGNAAREAARQLDWPLRDPPLALPAARILVVDDSDTNRKLIRLILRRSGSETVAAENGQQAVEATLREHFDLILMDMQMPVLDGYAAVRELRSRRVQTPILALTAHAMKGDAEKCFEAGCTGYLTKPIDADRLVAAVASLLATGCGDRSPARPRSADSGSAPTSVPEPGSRIVTSLPADDPEFGEIVVEFIERMRARLAEMENLAAHCRWQELGRQAHWLKGVGGTAGFSVLTEPARELERCAREGRLEDCRRALDQLVALASRIEA